MRHYNIPIFINHYGCPHACVFCNQKKINGVETDITRSDVIDIIERHLKTLPKDSKKEVAFFGGTFTALSMDLQKEYLECVQKYIKNGDIDGIRMSTRPDYINDEIIALLKNNGVTLVELGIQSTDPDVLLKSERYYPNDMVRKACNMIIDSGIKLGVQMMIGLPGSTYESDIETGKVLAGYRPEVARIYPTLVIKDTKLEKMYKSGEYIPLTIEEAVNRTKKIFSYLDTNGINVIRVGLQPSDDLRKDGVVLAGPFHSAFKELVIGEIYRDFLEEKFSHDEKINVITNERNVSSIIGINRVNKKFFGKKLSITIDNTLDNSTLDINGIQYTKKIIYQKELKEENR